MNWSNSTNTFQTSPNLPAITFTVLMMVIAVIGTVGNTFVILAVLVNKKLRTTTSLLILNLSFADLFVCSLAIPLRVLAGIVQEILLHIECPIILSLTIFFDGASRVNTLLIALDRFSAIKWPFLYMSVITKRVLSLVAFVCWTSCFSVALLPLCGIGLKAKPATNTMCFFFNNLSTGFVCLLVFAFCIVPLVLIIPINSFLFRASFNQMKKIYQQKCSLGVLNPACTAAVENSNGNSQNQTQTIAPTGNKGLTRLPVRHLVKQSKAAKMVTILIASFIILVTPISLIDLIQAFSSHILIPSYISQIGVGMIYLNSAINVFIYAGYNREFRSTFHCMFKRAKEQFSSELGLSVTGVKFAKKSQGIINENHEIRLLAFRTIQDKTITVI